MNSEPDLDHTRLVRAALDGDRRALAELLTDLMPRMTRFCTARTTALPSSAGTAEDVAQEVAMAVLSALPRYRPGDGVPFVGFVHGIARNKIADAFRKTARNPSRSVDELPDPPADAPGPEALVLRAELSAELRGMLDRLPQRQRDILLLRVVEGRSAEEVAVALGSTAGAVRVAQHRALAALRVHTGPAPDRVGSGDRRNDRSGSGEGPGNQGSDMSVVTCRRNR